MYPKRVGYTLGLVQGAIYIGNFFIYYSIILKTIIVLCRSNEILEIRAYIFSLAELFLLFSIDQQGFQSGNKKE